MVRNELIYYVLKAIKASCENRRSCHGCAFLASNGVCIFDEATPSGWDIEELQHNLLGGKKNDRSD